MRSISTRSLSMKPIAASVAAARERPAGRQHRNIKTPARATCNAHAHPSAIGTGTIVARRLRGYAGAPVTLASNGEPASWNGFQRGTSHGPAQAKVHTGRELSYRTADHRPNRTGLRTAATIRVSQHASARDWH